MTRKFLEPFRSLRSKQSVRIDRPLSKHYKAVLIASMGKPEPSDEELLESYNLLIKRFNPTRKVTFR